MKKIKLDYAKESWGEVHWKNSNGLRNNEVPYDGSTFFTKGDEQMIWFTSDYHLSHFNIIRYENRPFQNINEMNKTIIENHNKLVHPEDAVYFLGDFSLVGKEKFAWYKKHINMFNGQKHLILGNHDYLKPFTYVSAGFISVHTALDIGEFILVHDPAVSIIHKDRKWLCGHVHSLFKMQKNVLNVGVDVWDFNPVSIDQVREEWRKYEDS